MRQVLRWARNGLSAASLVLCAAALVAWPASHRRGGTMMYHHWPDARGGREVRAAMVGVGAGGLSAYVTRLTSTDLPLPIPMKPGWVWEQGLPAPSYPADLTALGVPTWGGFAAGAKTLRIGSGMFAIESAGVLAPLWAWTLAFALLPSWRGYRWLRRRRLARAGPAFEVLLPAPGR